MFVTLSWLGTLGAIWLAIALVGTFIWRRPTLFPVTLLATVIANVTAFGIKQATGVDRPPVRYPEPDALVHVPADGSFPSGHAATSFAAAAFLAHRAPRHSAIALYALAAGIAFSRVYVGVHYPLDAIGGAALGLLVARAAPWLAAASLRTVRRVLPPPGD